MKKIAALIMTFAMLASLTACGKEPAVNPTSVPVQESVPEENAPNEAPDDENKDSEENAPSETPDDENKDGEENAPSETPDDENKNGEENAPSEAPDDENKNNEEKSNNADGEENKSDDNSAEKNKTEENKADGNTDKENKTDEAKPEAPKSEETKTVLPLGEYPAGSYFTKDGKACTAHDGCDWAVDDCNCVNFDRSIWSMGFAKYVYYNVFGRHVSDETKTEKNIDLTAATAKAELSELPAGAYISVQMHDGVPHHMIMMGADDNGITVYQANYGGRCLVSTMTLTWEQFAALFTHLDCIAK